VLTEANEHSATAPVEARPEATDRALRVTVDNLNRLLGLAGESLVESRWLKPFGQSPLRLKRLQRESAKALDNLRDELPQHLLDERALTAMVDAQHRVSMCQQFLADRLSELEASDR
jgi:two-component system sensor histidine kinase and response regulator WspE